MRLEKTSVFSALLNKCYKKLKVLKMRVRRKSNTQNPRMPRRPRETRKQSDAEAPHRVQLEHILG